MTAADKLLTIAEYVLLEDDEKMTELVRGRIVTLDWPIPYHGFVCANVAGLLHDHVTGRDLGWVITNGSGVITQRNPDTVRSADIAYYSYDRIPRGRLPKDTYAEAMPELIFEVFAAKDRWSEVISKAGEYLTAGVNVVCVVDCANRNVHVFAGDRPPRLVAPQEQLTLPEVLADFRVLVSEFFS